MVQYIHFSLPHLQYLEFYLNLINQMKIEKNECIEIDNFSRNYYFPFIYFFSFKQKREKEARRQLEVRNSRTYNDKKVHWFSATMTMIIITCLSTNHLIREYCNSLCIKYRNLLQNRDHTISDGLKVSCNLQ